MMIHGEVALGTEGMLSTTHGRMGRAWGRTDVEGIQNGSPPYRESHDDITKIIIVLSISFIF